MRYAMLPAARRIEWVAAVSVLTLVIVAGASAGPAASASTTRTLSAVHQHLDVERYSPAGVYVDQEKADPTGERGSGGRAVAHYAGAQIARTPLIVVKAPDARLYRTAVPSWEPTMGITKSGAIFFNALDFETNAPFIMRSTDEGASWEQVFDAHQITADPYMFVDYDTGRVFANDLIPPCHLVSHSDDDGETWTTAPPAGCGYNEDHQTLFAGPPPEGGDAPDDYPNVIYLCSISDGISIASAGSACSKSLDGGMTFIPTGEQPYTNDPRQQPADFGIPGMCNGANAHGFVGPDGAVYLPRGWCGQPYLAISKDEGLTWTRVQVSDLGMPCCGELDTGVENLFTHEAAVVADDKGNVYYAWVANDRLPYLVISHDGGETWGEPMMIAPPGVKEALLPGMTIGASGKVAVYYHASTNSPWDGTELAGDTDQMTWNGYITMTTNALATKPVFYSATINDPKDPLWIGHCGPDPIRCGWGDFFDVVVSPKGEPWSVTVDLCNMGDCSGAGEGVIGRLIGGPSLR